MMKALAGLKRLLGEGYRLREERLWQRRELMKALISEQMECDREECPTNSEGQSSSLGSKADFYRRKRQFLKKHQEFRRCHRQLHRAGPFILLFCLSIWVLLFRYPGAKTIALVFAVLISIKGIYEWYFMRRLEKRIFEPIDKLRQGVEEIARGNYDVKVECDVFNDLTMLVASFNRMARQLQESEKLKAEYEENRKQLIANISHDLKTPITSIQGYIEAVLERPDQTAEERQKYLQIILNNTIYMNKLINDLFLFAKLDLDKLEFRFEWISVRDFMTDLMEEFRLELEENQVEFSYRDRLERDYAVRVDRKRIHQVVTNIIGNAIKYGPAKNLAIQAVLEQTADSPTEILISLSDNGPGIPETQLPYVFDRFYRIDAERTKDALSTGLGLAIARELVEAHNGRITVTNGLTGGSCFTISLPVGGDQVRSER